VPLAVDDAELVSEARVVSRGDPRVAAEDGGRKSGFSFSSIDANRRPLSSPPTCANFCSYPSSQPSFTATATAAGGGFSASGVLTPRWSRILPVVVWFASPTKPEKPGCRPIPA